MVLDHPSRRVDDLEMNYVVGYNFERILTILLLVCHVFNNDHFVCAYFAYKYSGYMTSPVQKHEKKSFEQ